MQFGQKSKISIGREQCILGVFKGQRRFSVALRISNSKSGKGRHGLEDVDGQDESQKVECGNLQLDSA